ncbi:probable lysophospholipase BODYGUARD 4 [Aristolochia californica]|uniref:probable lysophospholipase BODYGUARD 4 n=1 Tax=Aristolochia californica TaxID=171875 RepID=UPI0035E07F40
MLKRLVSSVGKWTGKAVDILMEVASLLVFCILDLLDSFLCICYRCIDDFVEENAHPCYCESRANVGMYGEEQLSVTLYDRKNMFRQMGLVGLRRNRREESRKKGTVKLPRWSDCGCDSCLSWQKAEEKLYSVIREPISDHDGDSRRSSVGNVIFLHGFMSSSSFWTETVFPNLSEESKLHYRFISLDLLGFGKSPKPRDCLYRLKDHLEMIEKSAIQPYQLDSFHLVAHSMGCIIALALAAKYPRSVKSITLIAPPYFPSSKEKASHVALNKLAERRLWPPSQFGSSFMSWYEHLGRTVCLLICRNHRIWEWILKLVTGKRDLHFMIMDSTRHTHHSAWHSMHNVICGGAKNIDDYLEILSKSGMLVNVIQGDKDQVVPPECSYNLKLKVPFAEVKIIPNAEHSSVVLGREKDITRDLEQIWSLAENLNSKNM